MLSGRLQALVDLGVILREEGAYGPEYAVTDAGAELADHIRALGVWGQRWLPGSLRPRTSISNPCCST